MRSTLSMRGQQLEAEIRELVENNEVEESLQIHCV
jgi:hypothetical protein